MATLFAPGVLVIGRSAVALIGAALAMTLVLALAGRHRLAPAVVVLAGLVVGMYGGAVSLVPLLFNQDRLHCLMVWVAGSLA